MPPNPVQNYFRRPVSIFGWEKPAWVWMLGSIGGTAMLGGLASTITWLAGSLGDWGTLLFAGFFAFAFLAMFLLLLRVVFTSLRQFTVFTLTIAGLSFAANAYLLNHEVFPPFTTRTFWTLWVVFGFLAASIGADYCPSFLRWAFQPFLMLGALVSTAFIAVLAPIMIFSWAFVWFAGLGFLPYSPLFACIAFLIAAWRIHRSLDGIWKQFSGISLGLVTALTLSYAVFFYIEWGRAEHILEKPAVAAGHNRVDDDLPDWVTTAGRLPVNHVTEMLLQPNRRSEVAFFGHQSLFDPAAYLTSWIRSGLRWSGRDARISPEDAGKILHLLFHQPHAQLERLWRGHSLVTTDIETHVQLHPALRTAYTETTLSILNENSESDRSTVFRSGGSFFAPAEEAIYTITVPEGSVCTKLTLWINGKEEPARLTFKSTARRAYRQIVGAEARDPSYMEWLDGNRLRLRVFPVDPRNYRTVRIGIISPLAHTEDGLKYVPLRIDDGPVTTFAKETVRVDLFGTSTGVTGSGIRLKEKVVPDGQVRQFQGSPGSGWSLSTPAQTASGFVSAGGLAYHVQPLIREKVKFHPDAVFVVLNDSIPRSRWKAVVEKLYSQRAPVYLLSHEWFHTKEPSKALAYLDECEIPAFNLYPLFLAADRGFRDPLWISSGEKQSVPLGELNSSPRFLKMQSQDRGPEKLVLLNGRFSEYTASLVDLGRLDVIGTSEASLWTILNSGEAELVRDKRGIVALPYSGVQLEEAPATKPGLPGSDLLVRLALHRRIMQSLGRRFFDRDLDNADLVALARQGMIVSPVSTLIVLESNQDYKRFGIDADASLLGQSKLEEPGSVPEPHQIVLAAALALALLAYLQIRRRRWAAS